MPVRTRAGNSRRRVPKELNGVSHSANESPQHHIDDNNNLNKLLPLPELSRLHASLTIAIVSLLCYWNSCNGDFVFDDSEAILNNKDLRPEAPIWTLFIHDFWGGKLDSNESHKSYRPLTVLTFRLNYWLANGYHPWGFHFVNVVLHAVVSMLSLRIYAVFFEDRVRMKTGQVSQASFLCSLIFAVHPVHTESVAGVVGRADLLCALFFFLSFLCYVKCCSASADEPIQSSLNYLLLSVVLCAVAMLCKEQGITALGICCAYDLIIVCKVDIVRVLQNAFRKKKPLPTEQEDISWMRGLFYRQFALVLTGVSLLIARWQIMGSAPPRFQVSDNPASFEKSLLSRFINYNYIYSINIWLLVHPWWLCFDWSMGCIPLIQSAKDVRILAVLAMWVSLGGLMLYCFFGKDLYFRRLLTIGLAFLIVPFLPASNFFFRVGFVVAERVLYLSSVGSCLIVVLGAVAISRKPPMRKALSVAVSAVLLFYSIRTVQRTSEWLTEEKLFTSGQAVCPLNAKVHYNIGKVRSTQQRDEEALAYYREAVRLNPTYSDALNNLGNLLKEKGEISEAEKLLERAVDSSKAFAAGWMNLGTVKAALNKMQEAETCYKNAIRYRKKYPDAFFNLGNLYIDWNRDAEAVAAFRKAVKLKSDHVGAWMNHILLLDKTDKRTEGIELAYEALKHIPDESSIHFNLGNMLGQEKRFKEAEKHFLRALELNPVQPEIRGNLGVLYHRWGKLNEAEKCYMEALAADPQSANIRENLEKLKRTKRNISNGF
ncbi:predicted protein [Nematostella vectensis]|uniref:dolichyl-phosphate-mannose--protein mannosyltransferase n=1 Tax=Nematostella vectensis TaxID=45351 RepID=A7RYL8_NEMVE|nr:protein O-mannosyl-transferase TMTC4 isoform X3 [Nematostella vectensis]EDO43484.1 predicted protein [Nematostella vectensis]|eukprot:XP_001635547.1 predicted protein [Nematostella vectensis]